MADVRIEALDGDRYLVQIPDDDGPVTILVRASPAAIALLAPDGTPAARVVEAGVEYLVARQRADDLPPQLDIEDVAAAYEGFEGELRQRLHGDDTRPA